MRTRLILIATLALLPALTAGSFVVSGAGLAAQPQHSVGQPVWAIQLRPADPAPAPPAGRDDSAPLPTPDIRRGRDAAPVPPPGPPQRSPEAVPAPKKEATPQPKSGPQQATPKGDRNGHPKATAKQPHEKISKGLAVVQPRTAKEREKALTDLYAHLATADDEAKAKSVARSIERLWLSSGSDTVNLLMQRAMEASHAKNNELALKLLDAAVGLSPDYAEAWNRRAYVFFLENNVERALGDLRRVLALDPNHYKALDGLANILKDIGRKKDALKAARQLYDVHPFSDGAKQMVDDLAREVEGRGI
ncbi:MAG: tetratricopeptide repeat protein [Hyphomicrobiaceae bacterium]